VNFSLFHKILMSFPLFLNLLSGQYAPYFFMFVSVSNIYRTYVVVPVPLTLADFRVHYALNTPLRRHTEICQLRICNNMLLQKRHLKSVTNLPHRPRAKIRGLYDRRTCIFSWTFCKRSKQIILYSDVDI
jgi:hypothetical protein